MCFEPVIPEVSAAFLQQVRVDLDELHVAARSDVVPALRLAPEEQRLFVHVAVHRDAHLRHLAADHLTEKRRVLSPAVYMFSIIFLR